MKKIILILLLPFYLLALDVNIGLGTFDWNVKIPHYYKSFKKLEILTIDISEQHFNFKDSRFYLFGNINYYKSDEKIQRSEPGINKTLYDLLGIKLDLLEVLNSVFDNSLPISSKYQVNGIDGDIGVGYDVFKNEEDYLGIGVTFGMAFPFLSDQSTIQLFSKGTNTKVNTYKFGLSLQGKYNLTQNFALYSTAIASYQIGTSENPVFDSSLDLTGIYYFINAGVELSPSEDSKFANFYTHIGYIAKSWKVNRVEFSIAGIDSANIASFLQNTLSSNYYYLGVGYHF